MNWYWSEIDTISLFTDRWGNIGPEREACFSCYGTGQEYGESCLRCGGEGWTVTNCRIEDLNHE